MGVVSIPGLNRDSEFCGGEVVFLDKVSVYARDVCTAINQHSSVNNFHQM